MALNPILLYDEHAYLHCEDGPAVIVGTGYKAWYYHGKLLPCKTQEEFERLVKLMVLWE